MKMTRGFAAIAAVAMMTAALAVPMVGMHAVAEGEGSTQTEASQTTYTITLNDVVAGHTYEAYQIFSGNLATVDGAAVLSNIKWANGQTNYGVDTDATKTAEKLANAADAMELAKTLTLGTAAGSATVEGTATSVEIEGLQPGYYLIKDANGSLNAEDEAYTAFIMEVVSDVTVTPKSAKPTVDKQVWDETDHGNTTDANWGETADHAINESFRFRLIATLNNDPDYAYYDTYQLVFNDTMSAGVTFESIVSVKVNNTDIAANGYTYTATVDDESGKGYLTIKIADLKNHVEGGNLTAGATVEVIYNAHLNEKAYVNSASGATTNENKVNLEYSNNPNVSGSGENENEHGKTPDDSVWVFTYEMDNQKVDENQKPLAGAEFELYSGDTKIDLIYDTTLGAYRPAKSSETAETMRSADNTGVFNIKGLDAGTYILKEVVTPAGYNTCEDVTIEITAQHEEKADGTNHTNLTMKQGGEPTNKNVIINKKGSSLPSTGGIGTALFYVVGGALVVGAGVTLITKKRVGKEDK